MKTVHFCTMIECSHAWNRVFSSLNSVLNNMIGGHLEKLSRKLQGYTARLFPIRNGKRGELRAVTKITQRRLDRERQLAFMYARGCQIWKEFPKGGWYLAVPKCIVLEQARPTSESEWLLNFIIKYFSQHYHFYFLVTDDKASFQDLQLWLLGTIWLRISY